MEPSPIGLASGLTVLLGLWLLLVSGCGDRSAPADPVTGGAVDLTAGAAPLPADLRELTVVEVWRSEPGLELSYVVDLDVDSKGIVFVADPFATPCFPVRLLRALDSIVRASIGSEPALQPF
jgi:hypothetical protein